MRKGQSYRSRHGLSTLPGRVRSAGWGYLLVALALTHVTIVSVTIFLHRHQAHHAKREQLVGRLQDWCRRAEASGIGPLRELAERLRTYA